MSTEQSNPTVPAETESKKDTRTTTCEWLLSLVWLALGLTGIILAWVSYGDGTAMPLRSWHSWNAVCLVLVATGANKLCNCYRTREQSDACDWFRCMFIGFGLFITGCGSIGYLTTTIIFLVWHAQGIDGIDSYMLASAIIAIVQAGFLGVVIFFSCMYTLLFSRDRKESDDAERRY